MAQQTAYPQTEQLLVTVERAAEMMSLHRSRIFPLIASGRLKSLKIGKSRRLPVESIRAFIREELERQVAS